MTRDEYDALGADAFDLMLNAEYLDEHPTPYRDVEYWRQHAHRMRAIALTWWSLAAEAS